MRRGVLWDTSAIVALLDVSDSNHKRAAETARGPLLKTVPFITNYIRAETHALLLARGGRVVAREWLLHSPLERVVATHDDEAAAVQLLSVHSDKDWSFCDAISFAVIEARKARGAFTFDRHFRQRGGFEVFGLSR